MDLINKIEKLGFKKIGCNPIENESDIKLFRKALRPMGFVQCPGVYMFVGLNPSGVLRSIYVGCSGNIYNRLRHHHIPAQAVYDKRFTRVEVYYRPSERYLWIEEVIIGEFKPAFNITNKCSRPTEIELLKLQTVNQ